MIGWNLFYLEHSVPETANTGGVEDALAGRGGLVSAAEYTISVALDGEGGFVGTAPRSSPWRERSSYVGGGGGGCS